MSEAVGRKRRTKRPAVVAEPRFSRQAILAAVVLTVLVAVAFGRSVEFPFLNWDDQIHIFQNPLLNPPTAESLQRIWSAPVLGLYIPMSYTGWSVLAVLSRRPIPDASGSWLYPAPFHLANLLVHIAASFAVWLLIRQLIPRSRYRDHAALFGAALFAVHPLQTEAVAWATSFRDLLSGFFGFITLWLFAVANEAKLKELKADGGKAHLLAALATLFFAAALLSKPNAVALPLMAATTFLFPGRRWTARSAVTLVVWLALIVPVVLVSRHAQAEQIEFIPSLPARIPIALDALSFYVRRIFVPMGLGIDYGRTPRRVLETGSLLIGCLPIVIAAAILVPLRRRVPWGPACLALFVAGLAPLLGLAPFAFQNFSTVADRYAYLSMAAVACAGAWCASVWNRPLLWWGGGLIVLLLAAASWCQTGTWRSDLAVASQAIAVNDASPVGHEIKAAALASLGQESEAAEEYLRSLEAQPKNVSTLIGLASLDRKAGRLADATQRLETALKLDPARADAHYELGNVLYSRKQIPEALQQFDTALQLRPLDLKSLQNKAICLAVMGQWPQSVRVSRQLVALAPENAEAHLNLARALTELGAADEAIAQYDLALRLNPQLQAARIGRARLTKR